MPNTAVSPLRAAANNIPKSLKPPLAVVLNLALSSLLTYLASPWIGADFSAIDRPMRGLSDYSAIVAWRTVEILGYWLGGWDAMQAASLSTLSLAPGLHYFHTYQPSHAPLVPTLSVSTAIDILSVYLPLRFLRPADTERRSFFDTTRVLVTVLCSTIYQIVLMTASGRFLTSWLLGAGWDLESVVNVHNATEAVFIARSLMMFPIGWAAADIIFFSNDDAENADTKEGETGSGLWGWLVKLWMNNLSPRTRQLVKRTLLVSAYQAAGATVGVAGTVKGGNVIGAAGMSAVWALATVINGLMLGWVGKV